MLRHTRFLAVVRAALTVLAVFTCSAHAQEAETAPGEAGKKLRSNWDDMLHFIRLAKPQIARTYGDAVLAEGTPRQIYKLSVEVKRSHVVLTRGMGLKGLKETIVAIRKKINEGWMEFRSDAGEIKRMIGKLGGNLRAFERARIYLIQSGEFAQPQLLQTLADPSTSALVVERIASILPGPQKGAVRGLAEALQSKNLRLLQHVAGALGDIQYGHAMPHLKEVLARKDLTDSVRKVVTAALISCNGGDKSVLQTPLAKLYYDVAVGYYYRAESLLPDSRNEMANVWHFRNGIAGYKPVPPEIFCDIYAMRMARKALQADPKFSPAVSLWLAAYLRREIDLPEGKTDPLLPEEQGTAGDYVRAAGAKYAQQVLHRALRDGHSGVAIGAVKALRDVAGTKNLVQLIEGGEAQPLVSAMIYPDRRVRFLAAEVLALAMPAEQYSGHRVVLPVLNDALRAGTAPRALLIGATGKTLNALKDALRAAKYDVIAAADTVGALKAARIAGGVDVAMLVDPKRAGTGIELIREEPGMATLPIIVTAAGRAFTELAKADGKIVLVPPTAGPSAVVAAAPKASAMALGKPLTAEEASDWAVRAAKTIRLLGLTGNAVYRIERSEKTLMDALKDPRSEVRIAAASALAVMPGEKPQQAIAALANSDAGPQVRIGTYTSLAESARRFGNQLTKDQSQGVVDVVNSKSDKSVRHAAAQALGALDLPSDLIKPLIRDAANID